MKLRKFACILLCVLMLSLSLPMSAFADEAIATVEGYLVAPGQYTNRAPYGVSIEGTLSANGAISSIGNFGGYVIYKMNEPIYNSDTHPYGIDFLVRGNAFNAALTTQEPGQVYVSQDGKTWYALAGSEHYEEETVPDYSITYHKTESGITFTDSLGDSGKVRGAYPDASIYTKASIPENDLTLSGVLLRKQLVASTKNGIITAFGYVDTHENTQELVSPYIENHAKDGADGQMDISWAVDGNGQPVDLPYINYIKVQTATLIDGGAFGEKSTEVTSIRTVPDSDTPVGLTPMPESITIGSDSLPLSEGQSIYTSLPVSAFDVSVSAPDCHVYIGNAYGSVRHYDAAPSRNVIRVIVQKDDLLPRIFYINTSKNVRITYSFSSDALELMPKSMTVFDGTAEEYGFSAPETDGITVLDAIVTAHRDYFGGAFTKETAGDFLSLTGSAIDIAYEMDASCSGFLVNSVIPFKTTEESKDVLMLACDSATLKNGDDVRFFFYRDTMLCSDYFVFPDKTTYEAEAGTAFDMRIQGYCALYFGADTWENILDNFTENCEGVTVSVLQNGERIELGQTDADGKISVTLDEAGTYTLCLSGVVTDEDMGDSPVITAYATVTVTEKTTPDEPVVRNTLLRRIAKAFSRFAETKIGAALRFPKWISKVCTKLADRLDKMHK